MRHAIYQFMKFAVKLVLAELVFLNKVLFRLSPGCSLIFVESRNVIWDDLFIDVALSTNWHLSRLIFELVLDLELLTQKMEGCVFKFYEVSIG